jgi:hypothetical protein
VRAREGQCESEGMPAVRVVKAVRVVRAVRGRLSIGITRKKDGIAPLLGRSSQVER